jgi:hypothetical protein
MRSLLVTILLYLATLQSGSRSDEHNYPDRRAFVVNACPFVELSKFRYGNTIEFGGNSTVFEKHVAWKNIGTKPLIAFEMIILNYDAFDQRILGSRWVVTGTDRGNWSHLDPAESGTDGITSYGPEEVFTAIVYVSAARLADGTVWKVNEGELPEQVRKVAPDMKDFGDLPPDPPVSKGK